MRRVDFYIDDYEYFKKDLKEQNPSLSEESILDILSDINHFKAIYSLIGDGKIADRYELKVDGKKENINNLNGYQGGVVISSCDEYFSNGESKLIGVVNVVDSDL